ncbi:MAG: transposase, partial [Prevotellaceae bacterium]|nr:transposase [Prevotellaceae bacterium]
MLNPAELWDKYQWEKQTYQELAQEYACSAKTIQRRLDEYSVRFNSDFPRVANVVLDTTYFGRKFGVMCFKDSLTKTMLHKQYVKYETNELYR